MFFNRYVLALFVAFLLSLFSMYLVVTKLDPFVDEAIALPLFFISLFLISTNLLSLLGYILRILFYRDELLLNHFNVSLRQGVILGLSICGLMGLQHIRTLNWWNGLIIIGIAFLSELYFVARD